MRGIQLDYKLENGMSSRFNQKMFGRISTRTSDSGQIYAYYIPGVLDEIPYYRIFEGRIFIGTLSDIDFDPIMSYCTKFVTATVEKNDNNLFMRTGRQRWTFHAEERGYSL